MKLVLVGMNHRTAPVAVRERLVVDDPAPALAKLVRSDEIEEAVLISTCNRVEVVALTRELDAARHRLRRFLRAELGDEASLPAAGDFQSLIYEHLDADAIRHVYRVASSLDSMVVGEPQILGQMKDAYRAAVECGACGPILSRLFHRAFATSKRVRNETRIAERPVSVARVALELARQIFESFEDKSALLVGAGEMVEVALEALRGEGLRSVRISNRTRDHAAELARRFGATAHGLDELEALLARSDVVLTSIGGDVPILTRELISRALTHRRTRPMFVIDIGVPRNVEAAVDRVDNVYLYDIDDLSGIAEENAELRKRETASAEAIVIEEQQRFDGWLAALRAVPTIRHLRTRAEEIRSRELERALGRLALGENERAAVDELTRSIVNKILHAPVSRLRDVADSEAGVAYLEAARRLFALDEEPPAGATSDSDESDEGPATLEPE